jgi:hypothetical protein
MSFAQNKFQVIKKAVPYELANFVFNYFLLKRDAVNYMYSNNLLLKMVYLERGKINRFQMYILIMQTLLWRHYL